MIQHVSIEVGPADAEACAAFWALLGFARVPAPGTLGERSIWLEGPGGQQVHLMLRDAPVVPRAAHVALVADDYDALGARLREAGFPPDPREEHWGAPRAFVRSPAGHRVEIMAAAPTPG